MFITSPARQLLTVTMTAGVLLLAPSGAAASECPGGGERFLQGGETVVIELERGEDHPNVSDSTSTYEATHRQGSSGTWTDSTSAGATVGSGGSGVSVGKEWGNSITYVVESEVKHSFLVPPHTTRRADYLALLGITRQGDRCRYDRVEASVIAVGYRITTRDHNTENENVTYQWTSSTHTAHWLVLGPYGDKWTIQAQARLEERSPRGSHLCNS